MPVQLEQPTKEDKFRVLDFKDVFARMDPAHGGLDISSSGESIFLIIEEAEALRDWLIEVLPR